MSRERRFFAPELERDVVVLEDAEAHHAIHVLRLSDGDEVVVFDGNGRTVRARVVRIGEASVEARIEATLPSNESPLRIGVGVAPPKGDKMDLIVQKLTELGVHQIRPLVAGRGVVRPAELRRRQRRWRRIALESCKQSARARLPEIGAPSTLEELLSSTRGASVLLAQPGAAPLEPPLTEAEPAAVLALIGPEGGWSTDELRSAERAGALLFGLGPRTLRTETAAVAVTTLLQWLAGDLGARL